MHRVKSRIIRDNWKLGHEHTRAVYLKWLTRNHVPEPAFSRGSCVVIFTSIGLTRTISFLIMTARIIGFTATLSQADHAWIQKKTNYPANSGPPRLKAGYFNG